MGVAWGSGPLLTRTGSPIRGPTDRRLCPHPRGQGRCEEAIKNSPSTHRMATTQQIVRETLRKTCTSGAGSIARWTGGMGRTCTLRDWSLPCRYESGHLSSVYFIPNTFQVDHADVFGISDKVTANGYCIVTSSIACKLQLQFRHRPPAATQLLLLLHMTV